MACAALGRVVAALLTVGTAIGVRVLPTNVRGGKDETRPQTVRAASAKPAGALTLSGSLTTILRQFVRTLAENANASAQRFRRGKADTVKKWAISFVWCARRFERLLLRM